MPDNWGESDVRSAWSNFVTSQAAVQAIDRLLEERLGHEFTSPPPCAPHFLWAVGIRSVDDVTAVDDVRLVDDGDGWYRMHARLSTSAHIGGYAWIWGDPDANLEGFVPWDDWDGLTEYLASETSRPVDIVVAARFRPLVEIAELDVVEAWSSDRPPRTGDARRRVHRELYTLLLMLQQHIDNPSFIAHVLSERLGEFSFIVGGRITQWEALAESVAGRYPTLVYENVPTVLQDVAGLRALMGDLDAALKALEIWTPPAHQDSITG